MTAFDWDKFITGEEAVGPGTTTVFLPILLPYNCCEKNGVTDRRAWPAKKHCGRCGAVGWTHGGHAEEDLRCQACEEYCGPGLRELLGFEPAKRRVTLTPEEAAALLAAANVILDHHQQLQDPKVAQLIPHLESASAKLREGWNR